MPTPAVPPIAKEIQAIETLKYASVSLSSFGIKNLPPLPVGVWHEGVRLTDYQINPEVDSYRFYEAMAGMENQKVTDEKRFRNFAMSLGGHSDKNRTLEPMLLGIGGVNLKELASAQSKSVVDFITSMPYKDIAILSLAIRLTVKDGAKGYVVEQACPHRGCPTPDDNLRLTCNIDDLKINYPVELAGEPVFRVKLKKGFSYKDVMIDHLDLGLTKLFQAPLLAKSLGNGVAPLTTRILLSLVDIPQLGTGYAELKRLNKLGELLQSLGMKDIDLIKSAIDTLDKWGCPMAFTPRCGCYQDEPISVGFNWLTHQGIYGADAE
jgi:hypothetical protein